MPDIWNASVAVLALRHGKVVIYFAKVSDSNQTRLVSSQHVWKSCSVFSGTIHTEALCFSLLPTVFKHHIGWMDHRTYTDLLSVPVLFDILKDRLNLVKECP